MIRDLFTILVTTWFATSFARAGGVGAIVNNNCPGWQRVHLGLAGGPPPISIELWSGENSTNILCDSPESCGYIENWNTPKAHWLDVSVETQGWRTFQETLTVSSSGDMEAYFSLDLCSSM